MEKREEGECKGSANLGGRTTSPLKHLKTSKKTRQPRKRFVSSCPSSLNRANQPGIFHCATDVSAKPEPPTTILPAPWQNFHTKPHFSFQKSHSPLSPPLCKNLPPQPPPRGGPVSPVPQQTPHCSRIHPQPTLTPIPFPTATLTPPWGFLPPRGAVAPAPSSPHYLSPFAPDTRPPPAAAGC